MKDTLRQKLLLLRQEETKPESIRTQANIRTLKKEALQEALLEIAEIGTCGMKAFQTDLEWASKLVEAELLNKRTITALKDSLFGKNGADYESCVMDIVGRMKRSYGKYFNSRIVAGESIYSQILGMTWNRELQLWESVDPNGWHSYSAFMPYAA